jgi:hypothetical protein
MAEEQDGLSSVYQGQGGTGEAVILKGMPASNIANIFAENYKFKQEEKKQEAKEMASVMEDPISKWTASNYQYFGPKSNELKSEFPELMRKVESETDPYKKQTLKRDYEMKWQALKKEATLDSQTFEWWTKEVANARANPGKYEQELQIGDRTIPIDEAEKEYSDPFAAGLGEEVAAAGGLVPWRVQNADRYKPQLAYDAGSDLNSFKSKNKEDEWVDDKVTYVDGNPMVKSFKGLKPERAESLYELFHNRTNLQGKRWREHADNTAGRYVSISKDPKGKDILTVDPSAPQSVLNAVSALANDKSLTMEQKVKKLGYYIGKEEFKAAYKAGESAKFVPRSNSYNFNSGAGVGLSDGVGDIQEVDKIISKNIEGDNAGAGSTQGRFRGNSFTIDPVDVSIQTPDVFYNTVTGQKLETSKVNKMNVGEFMVAPLVTRDYKDVNGNLVKAGTIIPAEKTQNPKILESLKKNGLIKYDVIAFADAKTGTGEQAEEKSYYTTVKNVEGRLVLKSPRGTELMKQRIGQLKQEAQDKNKEVGSGSNDLRSRMEALAGKK